MAKTKRTKNPESDFGQGLVYNLVLFSMHFSNSFAEELYHHHFVINHPHKDKILVDKPESQYNYGWNAKEKFWFENMVPIYGDEQKALSNAIELWANGASDHLYDIMPLGTKSPNPELDKKIFELQDLGLKMGHGFMERDKYCTWDNFMKLQELTKEIAMMIDETLGVQVIKAKYE